MKYLSIYIRHVENSACLSKFARESFWANLKNVIPLYIYGIHVHRIFLYTYIYKLNSHIRVYIVVFLRCTRETNKYLPSFFGLNLTTVELANIHPNFFYAPPRFLSIIRLNVRKKLCPIIDNKILRKINLLLIIVRLFFKLTFNRVFEFQGRKKRKFSVY